MSQVSSINKVDLLNNVKNRFDMNQIFTNVGKTLIIVNPYQLLPDVFSVEKMNEFIEESKAKTLTGFNKNSKLPPHVYEVAMDTIYDLVFHKKPQAIVISGESGAGKTETAKQAMKFITHYFSKESIIPMKENEISLEVKILACNPVLESFGNSKTVRNDNSSRFGKYIKIFVDVNQRCIIGAYMITYLLEKSRVCTLSKGERNYHIFYQLVKGVKFILENNFDYDEIFNKLNITKMMNSNEKLKSLVINVLSKEVLMERLGLISKNGTIEFSDFNYLKNDVYEVDKVNDAYNFFETLEGLVNTGFTDDEVLKVLEITSAVLLLGSVEFIDNSEDTTKECSLTENGQSYLGKIAQLLQLDLELLKTAFTINIRTIRSEIIKTPLKFNDCKTFRDTFAKEIYNRLFAFLVKRMNLSLFDEKTRIMTESNKNVFHIGLLDIFGFECFQLNSFEQFCINYANEKLQQLYISDIFKETERLFESEGLKEFYNKINFVDNSVILEVMDKYPSGVFFLLDNECNVTADDKGFISKIFNTFKTHTNLKKSRLGPERFIIAHTAKEVDYFSTGFVQKNMDEFKATMKDSLNSIEDGLISQMINPSEENPSGTKLEKFLGGKFRVDMNNLIDELRLCSCHYIRCLKPNELKRSSYFIPSFVMQQIKYLGILDTIRIRKEGYPVKKTHFEFYSRYEDVVDFEGKPDLFKVQETDPQLSEYSRKVMDQLNPSHNPNNILFGKTVVLVKQDFYDNLDKLRTKLIAEKEKCVTEIAMKFRGRKFRAQFLKLKKLILFMQRRFKIIKHIKQIRTLRNCTKKIQIWWRKKVVRKNMAKNIKSIKIVKNFFDRLRIRKNLTKTYKRIQKLKEALKKFLLRIRALRYQRIKNMVLDICNNAYDRWMKDRFLKCVTILQPSIRTYLAKKKLGALFELAKVKRMNVKYYFASRKIQTYYRMSTLRRYKIKIKRLSDKIIGVYKRLKLKTYLSKLRKCVKQIQGGFRTFYYRKKILNERIQEYNEVEDNLYNENNFMNLITLFPHYLYKVKNQRGSTTQTIYKLNQMQRYYEKKLLNHQPQLYFQASYLKLSPFDEPKLHFFAHVLDVDILINTDEVYQNCWAETFKEVQKFCIANNNPLLGIEIGGMHTTLINTAGKVFVWGWNGNGQCGYKTNKDKDYKFDWEKIKQEPELKMNVCFASPKKKNQIDFEDLDSNFMTNKIIEEEKEVHEKELNYIKEENEELDLEHELNLIKESESNIKDLINNLSNKMKKYHLWEFYHLSKPIIIDNFTCKQVTPGEDFTMIITKDSKLFLFGSNNFCQFGIKEKKNMYDPINFNDYLKNLSKNGEFVYPEVNNIKINEAKTAGKMNIVLTSNGDAILLSHYTVTNSLYKIPKMIQVPDVKFSAVECGKNFVVLLSTAGLVYTFGDNTYGQLGQGDFRYRSYPEEIPKFKEFGVKTVQINCGSKHVVIRSSLNKVFTWGCNSQGQLGNSSYVNSPFPNLIEIAINEHKVNFIQVSAGLRSTVYLTENRQIFACGSASDIYMQHTPVEIAYKTKLPELFSYDNHHIIKIHHSWNSTMSILYAVIAETAPLKVKLNNPQKMKYILNSLSNKWTSKDIYPPFIEHIDNYIASKHLVKNQKQTKNKK